MAKADFKSAFKTVPPYESQAWLSWALVYSPEAKKLQATRLNTQTFGSVGAVVAWHRTASAIQAIMESLGIVIFVYVDDCFWITPRHQDPQAPDAEWILRVF